MKPKFALLCAGLLAMASPATMAQRLVRDFQITKINREFVTTPVLAYAGGEAAPRGQGGRWLQVEAEFALAPAFTDELTVRYYILFNGNILDRKSGGEGKS